MNRLTTAEARELGVVLEVNRQLLHPRGLALEVHVANGDEGTVTMSLDAIVRLREVLAWAVESGLGWPADTVAAIDGELALAEAAPALLRVQDHRADPEGVYYGEFYSDDLVHADAFSALLHPERERRLGYVVQPLGVAAEAL